MALTDFLKCALISYLIKEAIILGLLIYNIASLGHSYNPTCPNNSLHPFIVGMIVALGVYQILMIFRLWLLMKTVFSLDTPKLRAGSNICISVLEGLLELFILAWFIWGNIEFWRDRNDCDQYNPIIYICALVNLIVLYLWYPLTIIKYCAFCYSCAKSDQFTPSTTNTVGRQHINERQVV